MLTVDPGRFSTRRRGKGIDKTLNTLFCGYTNSRQTSIKLDLLLSFFLFFFLSFFNLLSLDLSPHPPPSSHSSLLFPPPSPPSTAANALNYRVSRVARHGTSLTTRARGAAGRGFPTLSTTAPFIVCRNMLVPPGTVMADHQLYEYDSLPPAVRRKVCRGSFVLVVCTE
jgi:hypothetical protein